MEKLQTHVYEKHDGVSGEPVQQPDLLASTTALYESWAAQPHEVDFSLVNTALGQLEETHPVEAASLYQQMARRFENID